MAWKLKQYAPGDNPKTPMRWSDEAEFPTLTDARMHSYQSGTCAYAYSTTTNDLYHHLHRGKIATSGEVSAIANQYSGLREVWK